MRITKWLLLLLILLMVMPVHAQETPGIQVKLAGNVVLRSGPGLNTAWYEYLARDRVVLATGRDEYTNWLEVKVGNMVGWVPTNAIRKIGDGDLTSLPVKPGLRSYGAGTYPVDHPYFRDLELQMIVLQRSMYGIWARYEMLQGLQSTSCGSIPAIPPAIDVPQYQIDQVPELETFRRELTYVQEQTTAAITVFSYLCTSGINQEIYLNGLRNITNAMTAYTNIQLYHRQLTGLQ